MLFLVLHAGLKQPSHSRILNMSCRRVLGQAERIKHRQCVAAIVWNRKNKKQRRTCSVHPCLEPCFDLADLWNVRPSCWCLRPNVRRSSPHNGVIIAASEGVASNLADGDGGQQLSPLSSVFFVAILIIRAIKRIRVYGNTYRLEERADNA